MLSDGSTRKLALGAVLLAGVACASHVPAAASADDIEQGPLRGGIQLGGEQPNASVTDAFARSPGAAYAVPKAKRKRGSGHADDLRSRGGLRRDAFRLLLGGR